MSLPLCACDEKQACVLKGGRKKERMKERKKERQKERKKDRKTETEKKRKGEGGGERESQSVSDQMTLMPLDCRAIWAGGGGVWR